jgi:hypothetical protein
MFSQRMFWENEKDIGKPTVDLWRLKMFTTLLLQRAPCFKTLL